VAKLSKWRAEGNRLIECLDSNQHIYRKSLGKSLTNIDGLAMKEVIGDFSGNPIGSTFFQGLMPIIGIWATSDITICNAAIMPAGYGIGDHWLSIIDVASTDIVRSTPPKVACLASR
jgi:hypothetical protein